MESFASLAMLHLLRDGVIGCDPSADAARVARSASHGQALRAAEPAAIFDLWKAANVTSVAARRDLIQQILLPMLEANQGAAEFAILYLPQVMQSVPTGMGKAVREAVEANGTTWSNLAPRGTKALKAVGYSTERTGLLRLRERISRGNDD
ncbi:hypothetical protein [Streptomyces formicae]|uniref:Uncharacterized protein n=1 Tax=Streptomyces formicae TaxID=1616117 RepID=A0ABY3X104_9ACTN|nr:hypothetical protein [Streptomyces formicae]UNM15698.1 hypothetical protein J4032_33365 [Streptomyces formicae]